MDTSVRVSRRMKIVEISFHHKRENEANSRDGTVQEQSPVLKSEISSFSDVNNGLLSMGYENRIFCHLITDTRVNVTIVKKDLAQKFDGKLNWTPPSVALQTENIQRSQALKHILRCPLPSNSICSLYMYSPTGFPEKKKSTFKLHFENNELHSSSEDTPVFIIENLEIKPVQLTAV